MPGIEELADDLAAEQSALEDLIVTLADAQWSAPTPSPGWSVADQVGHLSYFDGSAAVAITDPDRFRTMAADLLALAPADRFSVTLGRGQSVPDKLATWRSNRAALAAAAANLHESERVPWYGPPMGAKSFLSARLMECWAHGQDIRDAVGASPSASDRLRHIAYLGFNTRGWTYANRKLEVPESTISVELTSPAGAQWSFGDEGASESVSGAALDFCLVVTQRRHIDDTGLRTSGTAARDWMEKAQAFAGPPTDTPRRAAGA
jgi:uncharacterized protein (TIGR03084 family)